MDPDDLRKRAKRWKVYSRDSLADLIGRSTSRVDQYVAKRAIAYDKFEGRRKLFSQTEVLRFLDQLFLAAPAVRVLLPEPDAAKGGAA